MSSNDNNDNGGGGSGDKISSMLESGKEYADKAKEQYSGFSSQIGSLRASLKQGVKASVHATNDALAKAEETTIELRKPIAQGLKTMEYEGSKGIAVVWKAHARRHEFGPHIVGGSALLVGALVGLRRGRIPGVVSAAVAGGLAYAFAYEPFPLQDIPDLVFGNKKE
mmetsp:Transcript_14787/g.19352  ORF Transcript_14787/g.19352 Transcript_14787/m.19352 type:complete len:167 (-) Transcript_14787:94-594(-)